MSVRVFASATTAGSVSLSPEESHYLVRVRRARLGTNIEVLDPDAGGWSAVVEVADAKHAVVELQAPLPPRPVLPIDLAVGLPDAKAAQDVVSRAVDCGARSLTLLQTERSQPDRLNPERTSRLVAAARRQCGRLDPLPVYGPTPLDAWLSNAGPGYVASLGPTPAGPRPHRDVTLLIGPEGGLTEAEDQRARDAGLHPVSLGPFVLRTEIAVTAALAGIGQISSV